MYELDTKSEFTQNGLLNHLLDEIKVKKSGNPFTPQDIQHYVRRGQLPKSYGYKIKVMKPKSVGGKDTYKLVKID